jgi:hypothetical protein
MNRHRVKRFGTTVGEVVLMCLAIVCTVLLTAGAVLATFVAALLPFVLMGALVGSAGYFGWWIVRFWGGA